MGGVGPVQGCIAERPLCVTSDCYRLLCVISALLQAPVAQKVAGVTWLYRLQWPFTPAVSKGSTPHWRSWFFPLWQVLHLAFIPKGPSQGVTVHPEFPHTAVR